MARTRLLLLLLLTLVAACDEPGGEPPGLFVSGVVPEVVLPGELAEIRGGGFGADPTAVRLTIGGTEASIIPELHTDGYSTFLVPAMQPGTWPLVVAVNGVVSNDVLLEVLPEL